MGNITSFPLPAEPIELQLQDAACRYCATLLGAEAISICPRCHTPHHSACWHENGNRCTTYACEEQGNMPLTSPEPAMVLDADFTRINLPPALHRAMEEARSARELVLVPTLPPAMRTRSSGTGLVPARAAASGGTTSTALYIGNLLGRRTFHRASCEWGHKLDPRSSRRLSSVSQALQEGFRRCRVCKP